MSDNCLIVGTISGSFYVYLYQDDKFVFLKSLLFIEIMSPIVVLNKVKIIKN